MGDDNKKMERTTAKRLFTRSVNSFEKAIVESNNEALLSNRFNDLKVRWNNVQETHERFICTIEDETSIETEDKWIEQLIYCFEGLESRYFSALQEFQQNEDDIKASTEELKRKSDATQRVNENVAKVETLKRLRKIEEVAFKGLLDNFCEMTAKEINDSNPFATIECLFQDLKKLYERCNTANVSLINVEGKDVNEELEWMKLIQNQYLTAVKKFGSLKRKRDVVDVKDKSMCMLKLEPMKLPSFKGDIRAYHQFKYEFKKFVLPKLDSMDSAAYVLKSCIIGAASHVIANVDDNIEEMWVRLDDKFGRPTKLVDMVLKDIKTMSAIPDGNDSKFIALVDMIERGHRDLKRIEFEKEISNATTVSMVEAILPKFILREWSREVNRKDSKVEEGKKFDYLLEFLLEQKRILEYQAADLRSSDAYPKKVINRNLADNVSCWIHKSDSHVIEDCNVYLSKSNEDRVTCVKENGACFRCLVTGHRSADCINKQRCTITNCGKLHHSSLHEAHRLGLVFHSVSHKENKGVVERCLLQIMKIKTSKKNVDANILWDAGATTSLITFKKASDMRLKGQSVTLSIVKLGGELEDIESFAYDLLLIDLSGRIRVFKVYGIEKISSHLQPLDLTNVTQLFTNLAESEVCRPIGEIDVLIGSDYAAFHPQIKDAIDHLVVVENDFGKCLSGKHPLLRETTKTVLSYAQVNHFVSQPTLSNFFEYESLGVNSKPKCGACKCGRCPIGGKNYNLKEERELALIERGLEHKDGCWTSNLSMDKKP